MVVDVVVDLGLMNDELTIRLALMSKKLQGTCLVVSLEFNISLLLTQIEPVFSALKMSPASCTYQMISSQTMSKCDACEYQKSSWIR